MNCSVPHFMSPCGVIHRRQSNFRDFVFAHFHSRSRYNNIGSKLCSPDELISSCAARQVNYEHVAIFSRKTEFLCICFPPGCPVWKIETFLCGKKRDFSRSNCVIYWPVVIMAQQGNYVRWKIWLCLRGHKMLQSNNICGVCNKFDFFRGAKNGFLPAEKQRVIG